jgi:hypothetical protein
MTAGFPIIKKTFRVPERRNVAFLQFTVREKQKACVPGVPKGTRHVRLGLLSPSPPPPVWWNDIINFTPSTILFYSVSCKYKLTSYYYTISLLQVSAQGLHFLLLLSYNLSKDSGGFCGEMNNTLYYVYSWNINPVSCFIIFCLGFYGLILPCIWFLLG